MAPPAQRARAEMSDGRMPSVAPISAAAARKRSETMAGETAPHWAWSR